MTNQATQQLVITREFDAPRDLVFRAWTDAAALARWWGPKGSQISVKTLDVRPGGVFHYSMAYGGQEMWGKFVYREVSPPERLVYINSFSDAAGGITDNPWIPENWPKQILNTLVFRERDGRTTLTISGVPYEASDAERETFESMLSSMEAGFKGTFEQLDAYLADAKAAR